MPGTLATDWEKERKRERWIVIHRKSIGIPRGLPSLLIYIWNSADGSITRFCSVLQLAVRSPSLSLLDGKMRIVKAFPPREVQTSPERN
ncbi:hypothetical protein Tco_0408507 [Tanacetum coccineum]